MRCAFSLVELLVAMTIFCLLCALLFSIVGGATNLWVSQEAKQEGFREARAALSVISRDLENAIISTNASWFYSDSNRVAFLTSLPSAAQATNVGRGDVCVVGYSLEWGKVNPDNAEEKNCFALYRYVRFSDPTYTKNLVSSAAVSNVFGDVDGTNTTRDLLARNVTRMTCDLYATNSSGAPKVYSTSGTMPDIFDFSISTINDRAASQLSSVEAWTNSNSAVILRNQQTIRLREHLRKP